MGETIRITDQIALPEDELALSFIRSPGPGGQNVNKVASAVQLRFALLASPSLPDGVKRRAAKLAGSRLTQDGEIVLTAAIHRTQRDNREAAIGRLVALLQAAAIAPKRRVATRPTLASKQRRLEGKSHRGAIKRLRGTRPPAD